MNVTETISKKVKAILSEKKNFTGQINIEIHLKDGIVKDVYVTSRSKVNG